MRKHVAVLTDATSAGEYLPYWLRYYAAQFGSENLFVVTYKTLGPLFRSLNIGGLLELDVEYSNDARTIVLMQLTDAMFEVLVFLVLCVVV